MFTKSTRYVEHFYRLVLLRIFEKIVPIKIVDIKILPCEGNCAPCVGEIVEILDR